MSYRSLLTKQLHSHSIFVLLSSQLWPTWSKSRRGLGQLQLVTAHWSIHFIRLNGWLRHSFTLLITPLDIGQVGQNWEDSNM